MRISVQLLCLLGTSVLIACGSSGSGVEKDKPAEDLTRSEAQQLCEFFEDETLSRISEDDYCRSQGFSAAADAFFRDDDVSDADLVKACESGQNGCSSLYEKEIERMKGSFMCSFADVPDDCRATVGEVETCMLDMIDHLLNLTDLPKCDQYSRQKIEDIMKERQRKLFSLPDSCKEVSRTCDDLDDLLDLDVDVAVDDDDWDD